MQKTVAALLAAAILFSSVQATELADSIREDYDAYLGDLHGCRSRPGPPKRNELTQRRAKSVAMSTVRTIRMLSTVGTNSNLPNPSIIYLPDRTS